MKSFFATLGKRPIRLRLFFSMIFLTLSGMILMVLAIHSAYAETMRANEIKYNILATNTIKTKFDMTIELVTGTVKALVSNPVFVQYLAQETRSKAQNAAMESTLDNIQAMQPFIEGIHVINQNGVVFSSLTSSQWTVEPEACTRLWDELSQNKQNADFWSIRKIGISYVYPVRQSGGQLSSLIALDIDYNYLREMFMLSAIQLNEKVMVTDSTGNTLFQYPHATSFEPFLDQYPALLQDDVVQMEGKVYGIESIIYAEKLRLAEWRIIRIFQTDRMTMQTQKVVRALLQTGGFLMAFCLVYSIFVSRRLTRPIKLLDNVCKEVEKGNHKVRVELNSGDEFETLGRTINLMLNQVETHLQEALAEQKRKSEMQFEILHAQINPHFLYNTLDSIRWLAELKHVSSIAEMSTSLIQLLKYNLTPGTRATTLREELESVRNYITIQKFRYSDSFDFTTHIDEEALDCEVLRFVLQPLVENSIFHGFEDLVEGYSICISAIFSGDRLCIKVIDNGVGMNPEQVRIVNDAQWKKHRFNQVGIANIRERIKLYFGEEYDVRYDSLPRVGTIAEIVLPIIRRKAPCPQEKVIP